MKQHKIALFLLLRYRPSFPPTRLLPATPRLAYTLRFMVRKTQARQIALQILFQFDSQGEVDKEMAAQAAEGGADDLETRQRALEMAYGAWENREISDTWIERVAPQWPPRRQPGVDRNILRLAIWELTHIDTPPKVILDEAIELAKNYSTENSPSFINGVLDAVVKEHNKLVEGT